MIDSAQNEVSRTMQISVHDSDMPLKMAQTILIGFDDSRGGGSQNERVERFENLPTARCTEYHEKLAKRAVWPTK